MPIGINVEERRKLIETWENKPGRMSIKDIQDQDIKSNLAVMLDNQANKDFYGNLFESSDAAINLTQLGSDGLVNGTSSTDSYKFRPVSLALVRRSFPDLFANKIVGVQAMSTPVGLAFALRMTYGDGQGIEAGWNKVAEYAGYSGSTRYTSAALAAPVGSGDLSATPGATGIYDTSATGEYASAAETWQIAGTSATPEWPQLTMRIDQQQIFAKDRQLAASVSLRALQDIKAMQGIDVEREMVNMLQYELTAELDRETLYNIKAAAVNTAVGGEVVSPIDLTGNGVGIDGRWAGEKFMNIISTIVYFGERVATTTMRNPANFVVVSPTIASALQAAGHQFVNYTQNVNPNTSMAAVGKLNGTMEVYRDRYAKTDYALVGLKGAGISDAGVIFCPYIMGLENRAISADDFSPRVGVISRYAFVNNMLGAGLYYRLIPFYNANKLIAGASASIV